MSEKSYVSMGICPICEKENGSILLDRRLKPSMGRYTQTLDPCDKCKAEILPHCVLLFTKESEHSKEVIGRITVPNEIFEICLNRPVPEQKIAFCDPATAEAFEAIIKSHLDKLKSDLCSQ